MLGYNELKMLFPNRSKDYIYKLIRKLKEKYNCNYTQSVISADIVSKEFNIEIDNKNSVTDCNRWHTTHIKIIAQKWRKYNEI